MTEKSDAEKRPRRSEAWGPISKYVADNLLRIRTARGLSTLRLADALKELGQPVTASGITRIEKGDRRVDTDDLVALALALNVSPNALLLPPEWSDNEIALTTTKDFRARIAWLWAEGRAPASKYGTEDDVTVIEDDDDSEAEYWRQREDYEALTHPLQRRRAARHSANRAVKELDEAVDRLVMITVAGDPESAAKQLKTAKLRMDQLGTELRGLALKLGVDYE